MRPASLATQLQASTVVAVCRKECLRAGVNFGDGAKLTPEEFAEPDLPGGLLHTDPEVKWSSGPLWTRCPCAGARPEGRHVLRFRCRRAGSHARATRTGTDACTCSSACASASAGASEARTRTGASAFGSSCTSAGGRAIHSSSGCSCRCPANTQPATHARSTRCPGPVGNSSTGRC